METITLIVLAEIAFILTILLLTVLYVGWKRKQDNHAALERLFNNFTERTQGRKTVLTGHLIERYQMARPSAMNLSEDFVEAEKKFMHAFMEQQMKQTPVTDFYHNLCDLLDHYINLLPGATADSGLHRAQEQSHDARNRLDDVIASTADEQDFDAGWAEILSELDLDK